MTSNWILRISAATAVFGLAVLAACGGGGGGAGGNDVPPAQAGTVATLAGAAGQTGASDGSAAQARFNAPEGVAVGANGVVFVADTGNHTIRRIAPDGAVSTLAGSAGLNGTLDGTGSGARFTAPRDLAIDPAGNLYVRDDGGVRKVTQAGVVTTLQHVATPFVAVDAGGNLYTLGADFSVQRSTPAGMTSTVVAKPPADPQLQQGVYRAFAIDAQGNFYTAESVSIPTGSRPKFGLVRKFNAQGVQTASAQVVAPTNLAVDSGGRLYAACGGVVSNEFPTGSSTGCSGVLTFDSNFVPGTLAGVGQVTRLPPGFTEGVGSADGLGTTARFNFPKDVAVGTAGIYVADTGNHTIRRIQP